MELNEDFIIGHEEHFAAALVDKLGLVKALAYIDGVSVLIRTDAEQQHAELTAALGQPEKPARRERAATQATTRKPPVDDDEAMKLVLEELRRAGEPLSPRALAIRTGATSEQVDAALKVISGLAKHGRKYTLKAGS